MLSTICDVLNWHRLASAEDGRSRVFARALGETEKGYYWDSLLQGASDTMSHFIIQPISGPSTGSSKSDLLEIMFSSQRFEDTWVHLKQRFPLLGARIEEQGGGDTVRFVVDERRLCAGLDNFLFVDAGTSTGFSESDPDQQINGPRVLSNDKLATLTVLRCMDDTGSPPTFHLLFHISHIISDGMSNYSLCSSYLEALSSLDHDAMRSPPDLESCLLKSISLEARMPFQQMTRPRRHWRLAIARVLSDIRMRKQAGGQTLPHRMTPATPVTPAVSSQLTAQVDEAATVTILRSCRARMVTFGDMLPVLGQVAMSRVLHRRRARGEIGDTEWAYRLRQPAHMWGVVNLRPVLDPDSRVTGGASGGYLCISEFTSISLPFMPHLPVAAYSGAMPCDESGAPPFAALLSRPRLFARAMLAKRQMAAYVRHPLFHELTLARIPEWSAGLRAAARLWQAAQAGEHIVLPAEDPDAVVHQACVASFGSVDRIMPVVYPSSWAKAEVEPALSGNVGNMLGRASTDSGLQPTLRLLSGRSTYRSRPGDLYLTAATANGKLILVVSYDGNAWDDALVQEWLEDIRAAAMHYLVAGQEQTDVQARL